METNIDDTSSEILGYVIQKLENISLDVFYTPIFMKKNRPAYKLSVLYDEKSEKKIEKIIFRHTTTIGIRKYFVDRDILDRKIEKFDIDSEQVQVKVARYEEETYVYTEFESAKKLSEKLNIPIKQAYRLIEDKYYERYNKRKDNK